MGIVGTVRDNGIYANTLLGKDIPPITWIVQDILPTGLTILAGSPKIGKSWLALDLCLAVADGVPFWGKKTTIGDVHYFALEDSERRLKSRIEAIIRGKEEAGEDYAGGWRLVLHTSCPPLGAGLAEELRDLLSHGDDINLIVIDTFGKIRQSVKTDSYQNDYREMSELKKIADEYNCAILVIHHLRKMKSADSFENISGTTGITGCADTMAVISKENRNAPTATLSITGRDVIEQEIVLEFKSTACRWRIVGEDAEKYKFLESSIVRFLSSLDSFTGSTSELFDLYLQFIESEHITDDGVTEAVKPSVSFGKKLSAVSPQLWLIGKSLTRKETKKNTLLTLRKMQ